jgi:hypothetical protein
MTGKPDVLLWLDDHRGVYIPRDFANCWTDRATHVIGIREQVWTVLENGPDEECYWDEWQYVLDNAVVNIDGVVYHLHQDGALWLVPVGMQWNDATETFDWPQEEEPADD